MTYTDDDFKTVRCYSRQEAAVILKVEDSILRSLVSQRAVPHQRTGKPGKRQRGVWFTYDDILETGRILPDVLSGRQANSRAKSTLVGESTEPAHPTEAEVAVGAMPSDITEDDMARFRALASLPRR